MADPRTGDKNYDDVRSISILFGRNLQILIYHGITLVDLSHRLIDNSARFENKILLIKGRFELDICRYRWSKANLDRHGRFCIAG